jgi:hypothetical protein
VTNEINRRDAVKVLGAVPIAGVLGFSAADVARAAAFVERLTESPAQAYTPKFFTPDEWRLVSTIVDYIIPRDAKTGSATDAKVPEYMDFILTDAETSAASQGARNNVRAALTWFDDESKRRFSGRTFVQATDAERRQILDDVAWPRRAREEMQPGVGHFSRLRDMTASGFFSSQIGWRDVDYMGNVAVPVWNGCPEPALRRLGVSYDVMNTRVPIQNGRD